MQINRRVAGLGLVSFLVFLYATTYAHELGHVLVCEWSGYNGEVIIRPYTYETRSSTCDGIPENLMLYLGVGGLFGLVTASLPLVFYRNKYVIIGAVPAIIAQGVTGGLEAFATEYYIVLGNWPASVPMLSALVVLLVRYSTLDLAKKVHTPKPT